MSSSPDERLNRLINEAEEIRRLNTGDEKDHKHPQLISWYSRAKAAIADKVGEKSHLFQEIKNLQFWGFSSMSEDTPPGELQEYFNRDLSRVVGALAAASEAEHKKARSPAPLVNVQQHQEGASSSAVAAASARVDITISVGELRKAIVEASELSPEEKGSAIAAIPATDDDIPTLKSVDTLLSIATKAKSLLKPILGWVLMRADKIHF